MSRVLIVEDEEAIADLEKDYLELSGFTVEIENNGTAGLKRALSEEFDMFILDLMLPGTDGFEICKKIREEKNTPILMVSAKKDDIDKIRGLGLGADDYITKPFKLGVLVSRINALLRRAKDFNSTDTELQSNGIKVLLLQGQVFKNEKLIDLTAAEYKLLCLFMKNPNVVLTKEQILDKLWDCEGNYIDSSTLTVYMRRLRMKIEDNPSEPQMLLTVRRMGYKWNVLGLSLIHI